MTISAPQIGSADPRQSANGLFGAQGAPSGMTQGGVGDGAVDMRRNGKGRVHQHNARPDSRIQISKVEPDKASGRPDEKPRNRMMRTRRLR